MPFKFQGHVIYEQLELYTKDLFVFTGRLPNYESNGLIKQIRSLGIDLVQTFAEGFVRTSQTGAAEALEKCISTVARITSLIDLCFKLDYIDKRTNDRWTNMSDELTKRLYENHKSLH
jgi:four helix bundle protein